MVTHTFSKASRLLLVVHKICKRHEHIFLHVLSNKLHTCGFAIAMVPPIAPGLCIARVGWVRYFFYFQPNFSTVSIIKKLLHGETAVVKFRAWPSIPTGNELARAPTLSLQTSAELQLLTMHV